MGDNHTVKAKFTAVKPFSSYASNLEPMELLPGDSAAAETTTNEVGSAPNSTEHPSGMYIKSCQYQIERATPKDQRKDNQHLQLVPPQKEKQN